MPTTTSNGELCLKSMTVAPQHLACARWAPSLATCEYNLRAPLLPAYVAQVTAPTRAVTVAGRRSATRLLHLPTTSSRSWFGAVLTSLAPCSLGCLTSRRGPRSSPRALDFMMFGSPRFSALTTQWRKALTSCSSPSLGAESLGNPPHRLRARGRLRGIGATCRCPPGHGPGSVAHHRRDDQSCGVLGAPLRTDTWHCVVAMLVARMGHGPQGVEGHPTSPVWLRDAGRA